MNNKNLLAFASAIWFAAMPIAAQARASVPVINHAAQPVMTSSGKQLTLAQMQQAITAAGAVAGWSITPQGDGKLTASLVVRGKHTIHVSVNYSAERYDLQYFDSVNMNYMLKDGVPVIHPNYNKWVDRLRDAIRGELIKL